MVMSMSPAISFDPLTQGSNELQGISRATCDPSGATGARRMWRALSFCFSKEALEDELLVAEVRGLTRKLDFKSYNRNVAKIDIDLTYEKIRHGLARPLGLTREVKPNARVLDFVSRSCNIKLVYGDLSLLIQELSYFSKRRTTRFEKLLAGYGMMLPDFLSAFVYVGYFMGISWFTTIEDKD
ncbi:hypothetical protein Tco_0794913 [Tanacetum coccineum]